MTGPDTDRPQRRDILRALALGAAGGLIARPAPARADDPPAESNDDEPEAPTEADARLSIIEARYGDALDEDALKRIKGAIEGQIRRGERLREFPLDNGDGPAPIFVPYRAPAS